MVDNPTEYYVVVKQYTEHPENIFKDSVKIDSTDGYNCFLLKDRQAVAAAVAEGATKLADTPLTVPQQSRSDFDGEFP
jgi:hypothetical protein